RRQPVALIFGEPVDDFDVLALNEACVLEALAECAQTVGLCVSRCGIEKSDDRHCRLLRARRERPRCRAAECSQHFPPSDGDCHTPLPCEVRKRERYYATRVQSSRSRRQDAGCCRPASGSKAERPSFPLCPRKRTSSDTTSMSDLCHKLP